MTLKCISFIRIFPVSFMFRCLRMCYTDIMGLFRSKDFVLFFKFVFENLSNGLLERNLKKILLRTWYIATKESYSTFLENDKLLATNSKCSKCSKLLEMLKIAIKRSQNAEQKLKILLININCPNFSQKKNKFHSWKAL